MKKHKKSNILLCVALVLCLVGACGAGLVQNSFGRVTVTDVVLETDAGRLTGYLFVPKTATSGTPAPAIVTSHGYLNNKEMQDINYVELSRRGYVVFAMDAYGHGHSSVATPAKDQGAGDRETVRRTSGGMLDAVEYISALNFVDSERIGVTGHSMGGGYADVTASYYTRQEKDALAAGATAEQAAKLNKVEAALIIGNVPTGLMENQPYLCEVGVIAGRFDEFFIITLGESVIHMDKNPIAGQLVALQQGTNEAVTAGEVEEGHRYINAETGYGMTMWWPWEIHPWNHFSTATAGHTVNFFEQSLGAPKALAASNQIWWLKEAFNLVGLVGFFLLMVPLVDLFLRIPFFAELQAAGTPALCSRGKKGKYVAVSLVNSLLGGVMILPLIAVGYVVMITPLWPQDTTGGIALWSLGCGLIALLMLRLGGTKWCKDRASCGVRISGKALFKTVVLALCTAFCMYLTVFVADWLFQTDFRIWTLAVRTFSASKIWVALKYLPFFLVFYLANSLAVSRNRFEHWSEHKQILVSAGWNVLGICLFLLLQYIPIVINGMTFFGSLLSGVLAAAGALIPLLVIPFIPILAIAAAVGVKLYRRTGNIYLAGILNALVITMLTVANTSFSFAY